MGSYTAIADAGRTLVELLRRELVPEPIKKMEDIGFCTPDEKGGCVLGFYLYDIEENPEIKNQDKIMIDREHIKNPPTSLNLYYMLFVSSESEIASRANDEQRIIGRAIQVLNDNSHIDREYLMGTLKDNDEPFDVQGLVLPIEEKQKIYMLFEKKAMTAFFYKAGPVFIESQRIRRIRRVTDVDITLKAKR